jgi:hypothetical protein
LFLQFLGNGERRNDMSASPAPGKNCAHHLTINLGLET